MRVVFCAGASGRVAVVCRLMKHPPRLMPVLFTLTLLGGWIASCSDDSSRVCTPGTTRLCAGVGRCEGAQSCLEDGSGYDECDCSGTPRMGAGGSAMDDGITPLVGRECEEDADCGTGLSCFESGSNEFFGGGPSGGYCSAPCQSNTECSALDPSAVCDAGLCLRSCRSLDPTSVAENKCLGRHDVVCQSEAFLGVSMFTALRQRGLCLPQCGSDEDCAGRFCDLARGLCTDTRPQGALVGEYCESGADCAGGSCSRGGGEAACTAPCVFGQPVGCGDGASANPRNFGCWDVVVSGFVASEGYGDVGFCMELCDVDADCSQNPTRGWICDTQSRVELRGQLVGAERFGRAGRCIPPQPGDAGADAGDAGTDAEPDAAVATPDPDAGDASSD